MTIISNSTSAFYDRSTGDMNALRKRAEALQAQLGSSERLARSSDDPLAASRLRMLQRADSLARIDTANADRATADLALADSALSGFSDAVIRIKDLATSAANGTLTAAQRAGIGVEVKQLYGNLVSLANARDSAGHALFGGEAVGDAYALDAAGDAAYVGTAGAGELPLGDGQSVTRGVTGPDFLNFSVAGSATNLLAVVKSLGEALGGAVADPQAAARTAMGALDQSIAAITTSQTVIGSRLSWLDLTETRRSDAGELRTAAQEKVGATDIPATIADLQQTMTVLEASQASFSRLAGLSLFDVLR